MYCIFLHLCRCLGLKFQLKWHDPISNQIYVRTMGGQLKEKLDDIGRSAKEVKLNGEIDYTSFYKKVAYKKVVLSCSKS